MKILLITLLTLLSFNSYAQKVKIDCPPKTKLKKDVSLGYLNLRGAQLGDIYTIKLSGTTIKDMTPLGHKTVDPSNKETSSITGLKEYKTKIDFSVKASVDMSPALVAELESALNKEMNFKLINSKSTIVKDPKLQIMYFDASVFPINNGEKFAIINRVTTADSLIVLTDTGIDISAGANIELGQYKADLINNCNGILQMVGQQVPTFFELRIFQAQVNMVQKQVGFGVKSNVSIPKATWIELPIADLEIEGE